MILRHGLLIELCQASEERGGVSQGYALPGGRTALHWAVLGNNAEAVSFLIFKGAWVESSDGNDETPLHIASRYSFTPWFAEVKDLCMAGCNCMPFCLYAIHLALLCPAQEGSVKTITAPKHRRSVSFMD